MNLTLRQHVLRLLAMIGSVAVVGVSSLQTHAQQRAAKGARAKSVRDQDLEYPPRLPDGKQIATDSSPQFLQPPGSIRDDVMIAKTPPTIDFLFYPNQEYPGKPWSNWGDGCVADGKYYSAIGDHYAVGRGESPESTGNAFVYEYDPEKQKIRTIANVAEVLQIPDTHYRPGKIHSRIDMGSDGWLYYATHRGSSNAAIDANHYQGDWILRTHPATASTQIVAHGVIPKHSIPNSVLDPKRMIFYGATAAGPDAPLQEIQFFAYDLIRRRLIHSAPRGPARYMVFARSTGRVYFVPDNGDGELMRFDPSSPGPPQNTGQVIGIRAATRETRAGLVFTVSSGQRNADAKIWEFDTKSERSKELGAIAVGDQSYVASIDADPSGRFLYYVPGAHGGGPRDGSPVVQYDVVKNQKKVIAFLHPFYQEKYGFTPKGTYSTALSAEGDKLFVTWNVSRGTKAWDCCGLAVVHIPAEERSLPDPEH